MKTHTPHTPAPASPAHTPEPWRVAIHAPAGLVKIEADKIVVGDTIRNESNATRLVACVNACAGMTDPAAEIKAMRDALEKTKRWIETVPRDKGSPHEEKRQEAWEAARAALNAFGGEAGK